MMILVDDALTCFRNVICPARLLQPEHFLKDIIAAKQLKGTQSQSETYSRWKSLENHKVAFKFQHFIIVKLKALSLKNTRVYHIIATQIS